MSKKLSMKSWVANFFTSLNVLSGFLSIVYASNGEFKLAAIFIIIAAIFDTLDGIIARLLKTQSRFGVELDSLSDVVSFGAAPSFLIYKAYLFQFGWIGMILSSFLLIFGAFRLARFNIQLDDISTKGDFKGLPIPLQAISIATLVLSFYHDGHILSPYDNFVIPLVLLLSVLMVSRVRYNGLPSLKERKLYEKIFLLSVSVIALILALVTNGEILFYIFVVLVLFGIFRQLYLLIANSKIS